jgi:hypothetical protein
MTLIWELYGKYMGGIWELYGRSPLYVLCSSGKKHGRVENDAASKIADSI